MDGCSAEGAQLLPISGLRQVGAVFASGPALLRSVRCAFVCDMARLRAAARLVCFRRE